MSDKEQESEAQNGDESQKAKKSGLNNSILGGFARTSAKRFAEYKYSAKENEARNSSVATAAPSNRHNRRDWLERLFDLFEEYAIEVNKLVDESHLITTCHRPSDKLSDNPLISPTQGAVSTKYWQLTVRLQADGIAGYLLPMSMEKTFLRDETLFERIFLIECLGDENAAVWSFDNKPTEFFQLPDLAKRFFGSLIEIARIEDISDFDTAEPTAEMIGDTRSAQPGPSSGTAQPASVGQGASGTAHSAAAHQAAKAADDDDDEAMFKDLLNFGSTVVPNAGLEAPIPAADSVDSVAAQSTSPFASLSGDPSSVMDVAKLDEQAANVRKKNKTSSTDFATKTLDSYALLDFEDAETYYSEYRLTPAPEQFVEPSFNLEARLDAVEEEKAKLALNTHEAESKSTDVSRDIEPTSSNSDLVNEEAPASTDIIIDDKQSVSEVEHAQIDHGDHEDHSESMTWEPALPEAWQHKEESSTDAPQEAAESASTDAAAAQHEQHAEPGANAQAQVPADHSPDETVTTSPTSDSESSQSDIPKPIISAVPAMHLNADDDFLKSDDETKPASPVQPPKISPVTLDASGSANKSYLAQTASSERPAYSGAAPVEGAASGSVTDSMENADPWKEPLPPDAVPHPFLDMHAYRSNDLDLLTPSDVDTTAPTLDVLTDDHDIAEALLAVTSDTPEIKESLTRNELSSEVQKLAAKLQQTASDLIGTFNRKAQELAGNAPEAGSNSVTDDGSKISAVSPSSAQAADHTDQPAASTSAPAARPPIITPPPPLIAGASTGKATADEDDVDFDTLEKAISLHDDSFKSPTRDSAAAEDQGWRFFAADEPEQPRTYAFAPTSSFDYVPEPLLTSPLTDAEEFKSVTEDSASAPTAEDNAWRLEAFTELAAGAHDVQESSHHEVSDVSAEKGVETSGSGAIASETVVSEAASEVAAPVVPETASEVVTEATAPEAASDAAAPDALDAPNAELASDVYEQSDAVVAESEPEVVASSETAEAPEVAGVIEVSESSEVQAADSVADPAESAETSHAEGEKSSFSDKFRRSNQTTSKKFQPYSPPAASEKTKITGDNEPLAETASDIDQAKPKTFFESLQSSSARRNQNQDQDSTTPEDTENHSQENSMPKTDEMSVVAAIEMMRHSVESELESVAEAGARAFQNMDMDAVERAMKRTRRVQEFKDQLAPALAAWDKLGREDI